jgi:hypothetical protein
MAEIIDLCSEPPRNRIDQILRDMEEVVREAVLLSEIFIDALGNKFASASPEAREHLAILLEEKTKQIQDEWRRAVEVAHHASKSAE